jgi:Na+/H+ antiporter NhaC
LRYFYICLTILTLSAGITSPQSVSLPSIVLDEIQFNLTGEGFDENTDSFIMDITGDKSKNTFTINLAEGKADTSIILKGVGNYTISFPQSNIPPASLKVIPGLFSIIPPLLAILLALIFRQVIVSLLLGIYVGAIFIYDYNPFVALLRVADKYIIDSLSDPGHLKIITFTFLFGGVVGLISKSGGTKGIADIVTRIARTRRSGILASWLSGLMVFFDDYANSLIVGNLMRPITDKMKISREKLAFVVDSTAAPVASIFIVSSWIGYEIGLIQDGLAIINSDINPYELFLQTIPYRFYPIAMLLFVFLIGYSQRDFGPMLKAEKRALLEGKVIRDDAVVAKDLTESSDIFGNYDKAKWYNGLVPILVLVFGTIAGLYYTGVAALNAQGAADYGIRDVIANSDSYNALLWASFGACIVAALMIIMQKIMTLSETIDAWFVGVRSMMLALLILTFAWAIGAITVELKTADYIISIISEVINPRMLPVLVFIACALTSFSTGTSWGTMAIMMPIVIPLAYSVASLNNYSPVDSMIILQGVVSSVLAGSVFGDHCSPIADTTILSSMASGCDHMDHVRTQLPYALVVGAVCMLLGDIPSAYGLSPYISLILITAVMVIIIYTVGKKVAE